MDVGINMDADLDRGNVTLIGSTICLMLTLHFSIQLVTQHFTSWKKPKEQKAIIIIVLMAPLYAITSFIGLIDFMGSKPFFTFLESVKECYEAIVMAKFLGLMYTYLNISMSKNIVPDEIKGRQIHHSFPMTLFQPQTAHLNHHTLKLLKNWTWQFVVLRPVCSILMIVLQMFGAYPSWVSWTFTIILNISVSLALYSLVIFYHVFSKELAPHKPLAKFLCVKGIVFFVFWQCPNCGNDFQIFRSTLNDEVQLCPFCTQPFSVVGDKFVRDPVTFSNQSTTFGQAFNDFSTRSKKGKDSSIGIVDIEAEVKDAE